MITPKLIVADLDGTLLRDDKTVSAATQAAIRRLREKGVLFAFATSRSFATSARFRAVITPDIDITSSGAIATTGGETLFRAAIGIETATRIIRDLKACDGVIQITVDAERQYFSSKPLDTSWAGWVDYTDQITTDFCEPLPVPDVFKITPNAVGAEAVLEVTSRYPSVDVTRFTGEDWYQIKSRGAAKHLALAAVCERLGFSMSEVVAFGDDHSDVGMLRAVGVGVAVANAIDEAKAAADYVCDTNERDGVAKWLDAMAI